MDVWSLILRGKRTDGTAAVVHDPARAAVILRRIVDAIPSYAKPAELSCIDGRVPDNEIERAVREGRVSTEVALTRDGDGWRP